MPTSLELCIEAAFRGGTAARLCAPGEAERKDGVLGRGHEVTGKADFDSQKAILTYLGDQDPDAYFLTEEKVDDPELTGRIIQESNIHLLESERVYVIDPICGSSTHNTGHWEWATGVGYMEGMELKAGASFAPQIFGGALYSAAKGEGAFMRRGVSTSQHSDPEPISVNSRPKKESYVIFGPDCALPNVYPKHYELLGKIGPNIRTMNMNGSCVQPLAALSGGSLQALVEPLQAPWDYASGQIILAEAGGAMQFYEMDDAGNPTRRIDQPELKHYNPSTRAVAFIAGADQEIVDYLTDTLFDL